MRASPLATSLVTVALAATLPSVVPLHASAELGTPPASPSAGHRLVVKLASPDVAARTTAGATVARVSGRKPEPLGGGWFLVRGVADPAAARAELATTPGVTHVDIDRVRHTFGDTYFRRYQSYLRASMDIDTAWRRSSGRGVTVAVIDTGVDPRHEDLPRLLRGRDFVSGDRDASDSNGHGTFVAGVIAAKRNNGLGIAGVSRASILPVRVLNARGRGRDSDISRGIRWAAKHGADVINLSLGGGGSTRILKDAVRYATRKGSLVVAASGNSGGTRPMYPAAYPQAIAVGATDVNDRMTWFSDHGDWLDVVAPGVDIASTVPRNGYAIGDGTSFSSPLVAGAAALVLSEHRRWSVATLRSSLIRGAADAGPVGPDPYTGVGVIDVDGLVGGPAKRTVATTGPTSGVSPSTAGPLVAASVIPRSNPEGTDRWFLLDVTGPTKVTVTANLATASSGVLRGDIELRLFDAALGQLDVADRRRGAGKEKVQAIVDDDVYVQVHNLEDTRWPSAVSLGRSLSAASPGGVQIGSARRPALIGSTPSPESYGAPRSAALVLDLGYDVAPGSVQRRTVQLIDGETGSPVARTVSISGNTVTVTPGSRLGSTRTYAVVLDGLRATGGRSIADARVGFRTAS